MLTRGPSVVEASFGDYRFVLEKKHDGTFRCRRTLIDGSQTDELDDWSQLPPIVLEAFTRAQNQAAAH